MVFIHAEAFETGFEKALVKITSVVKSVTPKDVCAYGI